MLYPIKGMGGIPLNSAMALTEGIEWDRHWMLINSKGEFLTQRENREFVHFKTELIASGVRVSYRDQNLIIPFESSTQEQRSVQIWKDELLADICDEQYSRWFSEILKEDVKLTCLNKDNPRIKKLKVAPDEVPIRFSDGYPYTILGTASLEMLNSKLEKKLDASRFRSTIVVETQTAHEEDSWEEFTIGNLEFKMVKPCARCVVTTIDQETGTSSKEPLKTLNSYRKEGNCINFSMNAICLREGTISVGDTLKF